MLDKKLLNVSYKVTFVFVLNCLKKSQKKNNLDIVYFI